MINKVQACSSEQVERSTLDSMDLLPHSLSFMLQQLSARRFTMLEFPTHCHLWAWVPRESGWVCQAGTGLPWNKEANVPLFWAFRGQNRPMGNSHAMGNTVPALGAVGSQCGAFMWGLPPSLRGPYSPCSCGELSADGTVCEAWHIEIVDSDGTTPPPTASGGPTYGCRVGKESRHSTPYSVPQHRWFYARETAMQVPSNAHRPDQPNCTNVSPVGTAAMPHGE